MRINGAIYQTAKVISGVPQGYVKGPILLVIYVDRLLYHFYAGSLLFASDVNVIVPVTPSILFPMYTFSTRHGACLGTLGLMECQKYVLYVVRKR